MKIYHYAIVCLLLSSCLGKKADYKPLIKKKVLPSSYVIVGIDIFNGVDSILQSGKDVWIENGEIKSIGNDLPVPKELRIIDGRGKYLIPGFIDSHVHMMASGSAPWALIRPNPAHNLEAWLASGVTTIYDLGGIASQSKKYRDQIDGGKIFGPSVYFTGSPITAPNGHPIVASKALLPFPLSLFIGLIIETADEDTNVKKVIADYKKDDVDFIKIINDQLPEGSAQIKQSVMQSIIEESHARGIKAIVHAGSEIDMLAAIESGADVLAHFPYRGTSTDNLIIALKESEIPMILTFSGFENTYQISQGTYNPTELDKRLHPASLLSPVTMDNGLVINDTEVLREFSSTLIKSRPKWDKTIGQIRENKIPFLIGTDSPLPGAYAGSSLHEEMSKLQLMGFSAFDILKAATSEATKLFLDHPDFGFIESSKSADLVILNSNPLADINNSSDIHLIIKQGDVYEPLW